ncbi:MAG: VWA domain-containing protein, partial [Vicinamibacterales bacterium]
MYGFGGSRERVSSMYEGIEDPMQDPFEQISRQGAVFADFELAMEIAELTKVANRANVSFYTVDPRGLIAGPDPDYVGGMEYWNDYQFTTQNSLRSLAELTGGKAIVNRNDFDDAFKEIDAETSDYYVVGFYSSNPDPTFRTRRLRVEVDREDVDVQHRTHYTYARPNEGNRGIPAP